MFYNTEKNSHGLPHDPFKAIVSPRPIGWIGSKGKGGDKNLSPYSFFNAIADDPKLVMFASSGAKDSLRNCHETGAFSVNMVGMAQVEQMNASSENVPYGVDEFALVDLESADCQLIDAPYVKHAFSVLECKVTDISKPKTLDGVHPSTWLVTGQVVGIHIQDDIIVDGKLDVTRVQPVSRLGYFDYASIESTFELRRPK